MGFNVNLWKVQSKVVETSDHSLAPFNHLFNGSFTHGTDSEHLPLEMVLCSNDLRGIGVFEGTSPFVIDAFRVHDGRYCRALLAGVSEQHEAQFCEQGANP